jgi:hypothetical protein
MSQELISKFITEWRKQHEAKQYNLSQPEEQEAFFTAATSLLRHLTHTTRSATIYTLADKDAISTIFIRVSQ